MVGIFRFPFHVSGYNCRMDNEIAARLLQLNAEFYQTFASQFSDTRQRIQPGVRRIFDSMDLTARILDLGCGNGELARELIQRGFDGQYLGMDFSEALLNIAREGVAGIENFSFIQGNLADPGWQSLVTRCESDFKKSRPVRGQQSAISLRYNPIFCSTSPPTRSRITYSNLTGRTELLTINGQFIHSNWQFLNSKRLRKASPFLGRNRAE